MILLAAWYHIFHNLGPRFHRGHRRGVKFGAIRLLKAPIGIGASIGVGGHIRLPHNQDTLLRNVRRTFNRIEQREGRPATVEEVADELDLDEDKLKELLQASRRNASLDEPLTDEDGGTLIDIIPDTNSYYADLSLDKESLHIELEELMGSTLKPRDPQHKVR